MIFQKIIKLIEINLPDLMLTYGRQFKITDTDIPVVFRNQFTFKLETYWEPLQERNFEQIRFNGVIIMNAPKNVALKGI